MEIRDRVSRIESMDRRLVRPDLFRLLLERIDVEHPAEDLRVEAPAGAVALRFRRDGAFEAEAGPPTWVRSALRGGKQRFTWACQRATLSGTRSSSVCSLYPFGAVYMAPSNS